MELPHIGQHCSFNDCNLLDYLPVQCDKCHQKFCKTHFKYQDHNCQLAKEKDKLGYILPQCPECNLLIPFFNSQRDPEKTIKQHLKYSCAGAGSVVDTNGMKKKKIKPNGQSSSTTEIVLNKTKPKIYQNMCNKKGCKKKQLTPIKCKYCQLCFCVSHRHETDHDCKAFKVQKNLSGKFSKISIFAK